MPSVEEDVSLLYSMLKQCDQKTIDWNLVCADLNVTNVSAARMRWTRFKERHGKDAANGNSPSATSKSKTPASSAKKTPCKRGRKTEEEDTPTKKEPAKRAKMERDDSPLADEAAFAHFDRE